MNNVLNKILFFSIYICCWKSTFSQQLSLGNGWLEQKFYFQVRQLSQFMERFNYQEKLMTPSGEIVSRWINLAGLINHEDSILTSNPNTKAFLKQCYRDSSTAKLNFNDSLWYASVKATFDYKGKPIEIEFLLMPEHYLNGGTSWSIVSVDSKILDIDTNRKASVFINPMGHEVGFLDMIKVINRNQLSSLYHSYYEYNKLSVLDYLIQRQELKFVQINSTEYTFNQIPGWQFTVKDFNRNSLNSGWLISKIIKKASK